MHRANRHIPGTERLAGKVGGETSDRLLRELAIADDVPRTAVRRAHGEGRRCHVVQTVGVINALNEELALRRAVGVTLLRQSRI